MLISVGPAVTLLYIFFIEKNSVSFPEQEQTMMSDNFYRTRSLFWSFWAVIVFVIAMVGYCTMDTLDYARPNTFHPTVSSIIYIVLAAVFVIDSILVLLAVSNMSKDAARYNVQLASALSDHFGSITYLMGVIVIFFRGDQSDLGWTLLVMGATGFLIGAIITMWDVGSTRLNRWANRLNLLAAILFFVSVIVTKAPINQYINLASDYIYLYDAILYTICWFYERQQVTVLNVQTFLINK